MPVTCSFVKLSSVTGHLETRAVCSAKVGGDGFDSLSTHSEPSFPHKGGMVDAASHVFSSSPISKVHQIHWRSLPSVVACAAWLRPSYFRRL